jgi:hypothetical protein
VTRQTAVTTAALGLASFVAVAVAQRDQGIARDEVVYMGSGAGYAKWWIDLFTFEEGAASAASITRHFGGERRTDNNREHPPLMKTAFGFSEKILSRELGLVDKVTGYRLPNAAVNALLVVVVFLFAAAVWGYRVGLVAGLLTLLLPRAFFHAGLATFDTAVAATWVATIAAYWRALETRSGWILVGVVYGLALATKHNAIILPVPIAVHYAWYALARSRRDGTSFVRELGGRRLLIAVGLFVVGPLVLFALWPLLWIDPLGGVADWIGFHLSHVHYNFEYLGRNWNAPPYPWHVAIVTTLLTVPVATLAAGVIGAVDLIRARRTRPAGCDDRYPGLLLFLSAGAAMGPFLLTTQPIFGAEKHWAAAIPTISIYAAIGVAAAARLFAKRIAKPEAAVFAAIAAVVCAAAAAETLDAQPEALTHYNALAGGAPGGADLGMNRQFWGVGIRAALPVINRYAPAAGEPPRPVYSHDASPAWGLYRKTGLLAPGLPDAGHEVSGIRKSKIAVVIHEKHFNRHDYLIWREYGTVSPAHVIAVDGVPIASVYVRRELRERQ